MLDPKRVTPPRTGASAILFALALPLCMGTLASLVEYGHYAYRLVALSSTVHEAVQAASVRPRSWHPGPVDVARKAVHEGLAAHGGADGLDLDARIDANQGEQVLVVSATVPYHPLLGVIPVPHTVVSSFGMPLSDL